jgi:hypothetical protein
VVGGISRYRGARRLALRHRRPPVLHQGQAGRGVLARGAAARGLPPPPPDEPHLLRGQVLRLPDQARERPVQPGPGRGIPAAASRSCGCASDRRRTCTTLEGYIVSNYGWRLYHHFFKTYNEKVWAVSASEISADWGAQRIKGMSCGPRCGSRSGPRPGKRRDKSKQVTSLIEEFQYPKYGPGMMWEHCAEHVTAMGGTVRMETGGHRGPCRGRGGGGGHRDLGGEDRTDRCLPRDLVHAVDLPGPDRRPAGARRGTDCRRRSPLPGLPHGGPGGPGRARASPTAGSTSTHRR